MNPTHPPQVTSNPPAAQPERPLAAASTVACLRQQHGRMEVLLLQRRRSLAFHGGAWVFPGGRVEVEDAAEGDLFGEAAARVAGVRESLEEASVVLDPGSLTRLSHWTTPLGRPRRFATWFFLHELSGTARVEVDGGEILQHQWLTPEAALRGQAAGELELPPPTFVTLTWLKNLATPGASLEAAQGQPLERFVPRPCRGVSGAVSLYHGDAGYDAQDPELPGTRHRLWLGEKAWRYERAL